MGGSSSRRFRSFVDAPASAAPSSAIRSAARLRDARASEPPSPTMTSGPFTARSGGVLRREEVARREAPVRTPPVGKLDQFVLRRDVVESIEPLNRTPQRDVAREEHVGTVERDEQEPACRPGPDARYFRQSFFDLVVGHARKRLVTEAPVGEPLGERPQRLPLASREAAVAE